CPSALPRGPRAQCVPSNAADHTGRPRWADTLGRRGCSAVPSLEWCFPLSECEYVLTLACPDSRGIVAAVANLLSEHGCNITESQQYGDHYTGRFFLRMQFVAEERDREATDEDTLRGAFAALAGEFGGRHGSIVEWNLSARE